MTRAKCDGRPSIVASLQHPKLASRLKQVLVWKCSHLTTGYMTTRSLVLHYKRHRYQHTFTDLQSMHFLFVPIEKTANAKRHLPCSNLAR